MLDMAIASTAAAQRELLCDGDLLGLDGYDRRLTVTVGRAAGLIPTLRPVRSAVGSAGALVPYVFMEMSCFIVFALRSHVNYSPMPRDSCFFKSRGSC